MSGRSTLPLWLQTPHGELRGETRTLERFQMSFELEAPLRPGDAADFRLLLRGELLSGDDGEVHGTLRILRIIDSFPGAPSLFSADILSVRREDQPVLERWLSHHARDGRRRYEALPGSEDPEVELTDPGLTDAFDPRDLPDGSDTETGSNAPYGFTGPSSSRDPSLRIAGREAIRSALRQGLESHRRPGRAGGRCQRWVAYSRQRAEAQARLWLSGESAPASSPSTPADEPEVRLDPHPTRPTATVRWPTREAFRRSWRMHLRSRGLFLPGPHPVPADTEIGLRMELPSGEVLTCNARVVAPMPTGLGLALHLAPEQHRLLEAEAS